MNIDKIIVDNISLIYKVSKKVKDKEILNKILNLYKDYIFYYNKDMNIKYNRNDINKIYNEYKYKIDNL